MEPTECMPKSALNFYIMLYCRKRKILNGKKQTVLRGATKSWLSLSESEKEIFTAKYNKTQTDYKQKIADSLKNVTPYLKKKYHRGECHSGIKLNSNNFEIVLDDSKRDIEADPGKSVMSNENAAAAQQNEINTNESELLNQPLTVSHQPEPVPPILKSGRELFEILCENEKNCKIWESLSQTERRQYQNAVLAIKKKYLKSYRSFLESLSPMELYDHYINKREIN